MSPCSPLRALRRACDRAHPSLLQWTEICQGIWYPIGGFQRIVQTLGDIASSAKINPYPAKFHYGKEVKQVIHQDGRATGVLLADGTMVEADIVVVNADLAWAHNNLFTASSGVTDKVEADVTRAKGREQGKRDKLLNPRLANKLAKKPHS